MLLFAGGLAVAWLSGSTTTTAATVTTTGASKTTPSSTEPATTVTTTKSVPSDAVLLALLGTGGVLVLSGALYTKLAAIRVPGGAEIDLSPAEKQQVVDQVGGHPSVTDPTTAAAATVRALDSARYIKQAKAGALTGLHQS